MKKIISLLLAVSFVFLICSCKAKNDSNTKEGSLLYDLNIVQFDAVSSIKITGISDGGVVISDKDDYSFLDSYTYKEDYPLDKLGELNRFPYVKLLSVTAYDNTIDGLYIMADGDIVATFGLESDVKAAKVYTANKDSLLDEKALDKLAKKYVTNPETREKMKKAASSAATASGIDYSSKRTDGSESEKTSSDS